MLRAKRATADLCKVNRHGEFASMVHFTPVDPCFPGPLKALSCLPNLRHFEFRGVEPADDITLFVYDSEDGYEEPLHDLPPGGLQKLERMAGVSIVLFNQPGITAFVKNLPMLKHFKIKNSQLCCDESAGQILSLESLELLGLHGNKWDEYDIPFP